jgi:integrase
MASTEVWKSEGKRGGRWKYRFQIDGQRYSGTFKTARTKADALQALAKVKQDIHDGKYKKPSRLPLFSVFVNEVYLPWADSNKRSAYNDHLICKMLVDHFQWLRLDEITAKTIRDFQQARRAAPTKHGETRNNATVNRETSILSRIFTLAVEEELLATNPVRVVKPLKSRSHVIRSLSSAEEQRLLQFLTGERAHLRPVVLVALHTGMREGELLTLKVEQLHFHADTPFVSLTKTKTDRARNIPLNAIALHELSALCTGKGTNDYIFQSPHPKHQGDRYKETKRGFSKACELAEVPNFRFHDLRHTFGTRLAEKGVPIHQIAELMGHTDIRTTMKYVHAATSSKKAAVDLLVEESSDEEMRAEKKWLKSGSK